MKKIYGLILLLVILLIPNAYGEEQNLYELRMYRYENEVYTNISYTDSNALLYLVYEGKLTENNDDDNYVIVKHGDKVAFIWAYDPNIDDFLIKVKDHSEEDSIIILFTEDDRYDASYYSLGDYDGIKIVLKEQTEFVSDKECTSVCINKVSVEEKNSNDINNSNPTFEGLELNLDLSLKKVNDYIKYKVNIKNPTDKEYEIAAGDKFSESDYIKYEYAFDNNDNVLKANTEKSMYITVRYNKEVPETEFTNGKFEENNKAVVNLSNGEVEPEKPSTEVEVPDTYTGLSIFVVFGIIALAGYISYNKISGKSLMLLLLPLLLIPVFVFAYEKLEVKVNTHIEIQITRNILEKRYEYSYDKDFWEYHEYIKTVTFLNKIEEPEDYSFKYDVSDAKDNSVIAYLVQNEEPYLYDLYIMANGKIYGNPDSSSLFAYMEELTNINNIEYFDTSLVLDMSYMFFYCNYLEELDLSNFDTRNVIDMEGMFGNNYYTSTLTELDLSSFDTGNVTNMNSMFKGLSRLDSLNLGPNFDTSKVTDMQAMFYLTGNASSVFTLDLGNKFNTSKVTDMSIMFDQTGYSNPNFVLDLGPNFDTSKVIKMSRMFFNYHGTAIYVPTTFVTTAVTDSDNMFVDNRYLVGGAGTVFDSSHTDKAYARIDGGPSNPGYFTLRTEG